MTTTGRLIASVVMCCALTASVQAETLEDVQKKIHDKMSKYKSLQYKLTTTTDQSSPDFAMKMTSKQQAAYVNKGDKILAWAETTTTAWQKFAGQEETVETRALDVCDGDYAYNLVEQNGQKTATKQKAGLGRDSSPFNPMANFKAVEEHFTMRLLPEETIDGKKAYVFELKLKPAPHVDENMRSLAYYDKETGVSLKSIAYDGKGKITNTTVVTDIQIDKDISPDKFVFKAPPGVEVREIKQDQPHSHP